jgi:hypothetical protein
MRRIHLLTALTALALLVPAGSASAGSLFVTGHDPDCHSGSSLCSRDGQTHFLRVAIDFVRRGAPDPTKPALVLACNSADSNAIDLGAAINRNFTEQEVPRRIMCPTGPDFATEPLTTDRYSAVLVGSSCGLSINSRDACTRPDGPTPDSDAITARKADIAAFFNQGGGVMALAGRENGDGDPTTGRDSYYDFVPVGVGGKVVTPPFTLTPVGEAVGLEDSANGTGTNNDINCCETHNSFTEPAAGTPLQVAERDSTGAAETLVVGNGRIEGGQFTGTPDYPPSASNPLGLPSTKKCLDKRKFKFRIHQPSSGSVTRVEVSINGTLTKTLRGKRVSTVSIAALPKTKRYKVKIVATTSNLTKTTTTRTYKACKKSRARGHRGRAKVT